MFSNHKTYEHFIPCPIKMISSIREVLLHRGTLPYILWGYLSVFIINYFFYNYKINSKIDFFFFFLVGSILVSSESLNMYI
jgi:hypothetical protein